MDDNQRNEAQPTCDCPPGECCPTEPGEPQAAATSGGKWKMFAFAVVMLLAVGVAAHSVFRRNGNEAGTQANAAAPKASAADSLEEAGATPGIRTLTTVDGLETELGRHDFMFVLLPAPKEETSENAKKALESAAAKIRTRSANVGMFQFERDSVGYGQAIQRLSIKRLPAVLALREGCEGEMLAGNITETRLLKAYLECSGPSRECCPKPGEPGAGNATMFGP